MIGCLQTRVRKQPIIALYFEFENELKFYNLEASVVCVCVCLCVRSKVDSLFIDSKNPIKYNR